jgi:hypothetical protein
VRVAYDALEIGGADVAQFAVEAVEIELDRPAPCERPRADEGDGGEGSDQERQLDAK